MSDDRLEKMPIERYARISECGRYRYALGRVWGDGDALCFVMLNPSTADATIDDPTIRRCMGFARREGYGGISVLNLYALRATDPKVMLAASDAIGPQNDAYLRLALAEQTRRGNPVIAAWGVHAHPSRASAVMSLVPGADWRCLGTTKDGSPRHPLYVKGDQPFWHLPTPENAQ